MSSGTQEFLTRLEKLDVRLRVDGERLAYSAPPGVITEGLKAELAQRKAELLAALPRSADTRERLGRIPVVPRGPSVPLSFAQQRLWVLNQIEPSPAYNLPLAIRLTGDLNVTALERTLNVILGRHETLRTTFRSEESGPLQVIAKGVSLELPVVDVGDLPESEREAGALRLLREEARRPFDLSSGLMLRCLLLRLTPRDHVLLLTMHHIASDFWSLQILFRELTTAYAAFSRGLNPSLPDLPIQYADFAVWQRRSLQGSVLENQLSYWSRQLAGSPTLLDLPSDRPRPALQSFEGACEILELPRELSQSLRALSRREGVTLYMMLLAAFQVLLSRYTHADEVVVGSPIAGRTNTETESLIGFFVNTLVIRQSLSGDPSVRELLQRVRQTALQAYDHQDVPFERLVEELKPERSLSHSPLFQVMFALQEALEKPPELPGLDVRAFWVETDTSKVDLSLFVEDESALTCRVEYCVALFNKETVTRLLEHYRTLLEAMVEDPSRPISKLPIHTLESRRRLLVDWNATLRERPEPARIHDLVDAQTERTPDAVAVICGTERITYRELGDRSNRIASVLRGFGVGPQKFVGIFLDRSTEMLVAILGVLKAGGAYVPLDPQYPRERIRFMLDDTAAEVVLTRQSLAPQLPTGSVRVVCLDDDLASVELDSNRPPSEVQPHDLAYVIYTSGSTGTPKGVAIEHRSAVELVRWALEVYTPAELGGVLASTSICFDLSVFEMFVPLSCGGKVILAANALALPDLPAVREVTLVNTVPSAMKELVQGRGLPNGVRVVNLAGEPLSSELVRHVYAAGGVQRVFDLYGPSEDTTYSTFALRSADGRPTIGRPITNTQIYILDGRMEPVAIGVAGEIYIGGDGLARGYLNRPELTRERFVPNPFSQKPESRLYKTGDLARYLPDGNIEFLGRLDNQVKVRGFRIELGEIEAVLRRHPHVADAVAVVRRESGDGRLLAYWVCRDGQQPTSRDLKVFLGERLPEYLIPSVFVRLESLPLTANGKVDRRALPAPDPLPVDRPEPALAPRDEVERTLSKIWEQLLDARPIGIRDNFFELGGHSLLAARLFATLEKTFGRKLPLATLFERPTVEGLAQVLRESDWKPRWSSLVPIQAGGSLPPMFCVRASGGNVLTYRDLSKHLGPDQPVYGLQAKGLDGRQAPHTRVEDMATYYLAEVRTFQPTGPYHLGGASFGGMVAFEMAQQLVARGETVGLLALFDTFGPGYPRWLPASRGLRGFVLKLAHRFHLHWSNLTVTPRGEKLRYVRIKTGRLIQRQGQLVRKLGEIIWKRLHPLPKELRAVDKVSRQSLRNYVPRPFKGRITLFRASVQPIGIHPDRTMGWSSVAAGGLDVRDVPGHHGAILHEPRVKGLARQLQECLESARAAARPDSSGDRE